MKYDFSLFKTRLTEVEKRFSDELSGLRTGKATPLILDRIQVEAYGAKSEFKHVAAISIADARSLVVSPWDKSLSGAIQKAIEAANLGLSISPEGQNIRVIFPELTGERREALNKIVGVKLEEARIALRSERERVWNDIQKKEKDGGISEDEKFRAKDELQKLVDEGNNRLDNQARKKREELSL